MTRPRPDKLARQYRRSYIGVDDLLDAYHYAEYTLNNRLHDHGADEDARLILKGLSLAMVVSYARPFLNSRSDGTWPTTQRIQERVLKGLSQEERHLHDRIIALRNQELAHSDASAHAVKLTLRTPADGSSERIGIGLKRRAGQPLSLDDTTRLHELISKLLGAVLQQRSRLQEHLPDSEQF